MSKTVQRYMIGDYLDVSENGSPEEYELMGAGFNTLDESPSAKTDSKTYINDKTSTTTIQGYETVFSFESDMIASEKAVMSLYKVGRDHLTGADAQKNYIRVDLYNPTEKENVYPARKFLVSVEVSDFKGNGGETVVVSGNLNAVGDFTEGYFDTSTKTFTTELPA